MFPPPPRDAELSSNPPPPSTGGNQAVEGPPRGTPAQGTVGGGGFHKGSLGAMQHPRSPPSGAPHPVRSRGDEERVASASGLPAEMQMR